MSGLQFDFGARRVRCQNCNYRTRVLPVAVDTKVAKAERRVISTAMRLHVYKPKHGFGELYESHKAYLIEQLHRACDVLAKARARVDSRGAK